VCDIIPKLNERISVEYRDGIWIGRREDGSYISTRGDVENWERGDVENWEWKPATEEEKKAFNIVDIEEWEKRHAND